MTIQRFLLFLALIIKILYPVVVKIVYKGYSLIPMEVYRPQYFMIYGVLISFLILEIRDRIRKNNIDLLEKVRENKLLIMLALTGLLVYVIGIAVSSGLIYRKCEPIKIIEFSFLKIDSLNFLIFLWLVMNFMVLLMVVKKWR